MSLFLYGSSGDCRQELGNPDEVEYSAEDIRRARERATNLINSYLEKPFPTKIPFTSGGVPNQIDTLCDDLGVYFARRSKHKGPAPLADDVKKEYYENSIDLLKLIATGEIDIPELGDDRGDNIIAPRKDYHPIFDLDDTLEQAKDPNLLDDITENRDT